MKKELTIKELAPYLPYELEVKGKMEDVIGIWKMSASDSIIDIPIGAIDGVHLKPLLRPLSSLTKEIEHNGYKGSLIEKIKDIALSGQIAEELWPKLHWAITNPDSNKMNLPYWVCEILFENHIDVFNLIPSGLAIEKT